MLLFVVGVRRPLNHLEGGEHARDRGPPRRRRRCAEHVERPTIGELQTPRGVYQQDRRGERLEQLRPGSVLDARRKRRKVGRLHTEIRRWQGRPIQPPPRALASDFMQLFEDTKREYFSEAAADAREICAPRELARTAPS